MNQFNPMMSFVLKLNKILFLSFVFSIFIFCKTTYAASFTATTNGNWNDGATWGNSSPGVEGVDYPSTLGGDTVVIGAQKIVTIPSGHNARASVTSLAAGLTTAHTKLIINGSLIMQGTTTLNNFVELNLGPGAVLDIDNKAIYLATTTSIWLSWQGTAGSRATVKSTTPGGKFFSSTSAVNVDINWSYVDITDLGNSVIGTGTTASQNILMSYLYFNNNGDFQLLNNAMNASSTFLLENSDFRNPVGTNKYFMHAFLSTATTTVSRIIRNCTFDGGSVQGILATRSLPLILDNVVLVKTAWKAYGLNGQILKNSFHWNDTETTGPILDNVVAGIILDNNFIYTTASNGHPASITATGTIMNNIFQATTDNSNFILQPVANVIALNNVGIGGNFFVRHGVLGATLTYLTNNTILSENDNDPIIEAMLLMTETSDVLSGTAELKNNLMYNTNTLFNQYGVKMDVTTADQIDYADYNYWYGTPGGDVYDHYRNVVITGKTEGISEGFALNDRVINPNFVDATRRISTWDTSLSGPGTASNAITEMLKMNGVGGAFNSDYSPINLINYMKAGFRPRNAEFRAVGFGGSDIGALSVSNTAPSVTFGSISTWNKGDTTIPYTLFDADSDTINIVAQYSTDNSTWTNATAGSGGDGLSSLVSSSGGTSHTFVWATNTDLPATSDSTVWFRIRPSDGGGSLSTTTSSSFGVDNIIPTIDSVTTNKADGTYGSGEIIDINVNFSENVTSTGNVIVTLETGTTDRTCTFTISNSSSGSCNYTVVEGDSSSDLNILSISGSIADASGNLLTNFVPGIDIASVKGIVIYAPVTISSSDNSNSNNILNRRPTTSLARKIESMKLLTGLNIIPSNTLSNSGDNLGLKFDKNLRLGMNDVDIRRLQIFLNKNGFLLANYGPGSIGNETNIFGYATMYQLSRFQKAHNIYPSVGFFGPITRQKVNELIQFQSR